MLHKANRKPQALKELNIIAPGFNPGLLKNAKKPGVLSGLTEKYS